MHALLASGLGPGLGTLRPDPIWETLPARSSHAHRSSNGKEFSNNFIILNVEVSENNKFITHRTDFILNIYFCETEQQCVLVLNG